MLSQAVRPNPNTAASAHNPMRAAMPTSRASSPSLHARGGIFPRRPSVRPTHHTRPPSPKHLVGAEAEWTPLFSCACCRCGGKASTFAGGGRLPLPPPRAAAACRLAHKEPSNVGGGWQQPPTGCDLVGAVAAGARQPRRNASRASVWGAKSSGRRSSTLPRPPARHRAAGQ